jgi:hypothetical protein
VAKWADGVELPKVLSEDEAKQILLLNDLEAYEIVFGELEEA